MSGWIDVNKELPPLKQRVLLACYGRVCYGELESADENGGYPLFRICDNVDAREPIIIETTVHSEWTRGRIKAWMAIPEPPKNETCIPERHLMEDLYHAGEITPRVLNVVCRALNSQFDIDDVAVEDLALVTKMECMNFRNNGAKTMKAIRHIMAQYGVKFKSEGRYDDGCENQG